MVHTFTANGKTAYKAVFTNVYTAPAVPTPTSVTPSNTNVPQIDDSNNLGIWLILIMLSATGLIGIDLYNSKKGRATVNLMILKLG